MNKWDKIYTKYNYSEKSYDYLFDEVVRITKTLVITSNWKRLQNFWDYAVENIDRRFNPKQIYMLVTEEIIKDNERIEKIKKIENWFYNKKFTLEEKTTIYDLLTK